MLGSLRGPATSFPHFQANPDPLASARGLERDDPEGDHAVHGPAGELVGQTTSEPRQRPLPGRRRRLHYFSSYLWPENARGFSTGVFGDLENR